MKSTLLPGAVVVLVLASFASSAHAQRRPFSPAMSCGAVAHLVQANGAVVIRTSPTTYDRYVVHRGFCSPHETIRPAWVVTRDSNACNIGYTCEISTNRRWP